MKNRSDISNIWIAMLPVILIFAIQNAISMMMVEVFTVYEFVTNPTFDVSSLTDFVLSKATAATTTEVLSILYTLVAGPIFVCWFIRFCRKNQKEDSAWRFSVLALPGIAMVAVGCQILGNYIVTAVSLQFPEWLLEYQELLENAGMADGHMSVLMSVYAVLLAPVVEELALRGLAFGYLRRAVPFWSANILQALFFAGLHANILQGIYTFLFALLLGYIYEQCKTLVVPIVIHMCFNGISVAVTSIPIIGQNAGLFFITLLISMVAVYIGTRLIVGRTDTPHKEIS